MSLFDTFAEELTTYGYPVLFLGVLLENAGVPVPGETAVLLAGYLASPAGGSRLHLEWVIALTVLAAVLGDNLGYWLGRRWARPRLQAGRRFLFLTPRTLELAEGYFHRYGLWTIFFARFVSGLRVVAALAAGTAGMHWPRFLGANAAGALVWAVTMALLGYFFGHSWELLHRWLGRGGVILLGVVLLLVGLPYVLRRLRQLALGRFFDPAQAQFWQGMLVAFLEVVCIALIVFIAQGKHVTHLDERVEAWILEHSDASADAVAVGFSLLGSFPVTAGVAAAMVGFLAYRRRPPREGYAMLAVLLASELVGLLLVGLLRFRSAELPRSAFWPFGFAGSVPLRAFAVYGMAAWLVARQDRRLGRFGWVLAAALIVLAGGGVVWAREQRLTEALLESGAGGLVLFSTLWWLEGYGPVTTPAPAEAGEAAADQ
jgi:membrane-associated protein